MSLIVFDFDGTIADSLEIFIKTANQLAEDYGYAPVAASQVPLFRTFSARKMIRYLGIPAWKLPFYLQRFRQELSQFIPDLQFIPGMREALLELHQQGYRLGIVTSNSSENVACFLQLQEMSHLFEFVDGAQILSGKAWVLRKLVRLNRTESQQLVLVGDEVRDVKAAKRAGLASIAVSWGLNDRTILLAAAPDALIDRPDQLSAAIIQIRDKQPA
ncbi:HAD-IA family hydrolase [Leptolyngbya ohadii]|uniref:HAD-IA family hydrolase n=1 Tax=Leptolyngbya ohadii TaxID=1962290 RepID=UPI000B599919|nr:HAD-IA family hydrolase [Leptolyngbya ohadii]